MTATMSSAVPSIFRTAMGDPVFGYEGSFVAEYMDLRSPGVRAGLRPVREEVRA